MLKVLSYVNPVKHPLKRISNFILMAIQWKILKNSKLASYPIKLTICPGNICNLNCALCPTGRKQEGRDAGLMKFELFKKIIDECGPYLYKLDLFNWGEPFLNDDIFCMIKHAKGYNIRVEISSNLNYFNDEMCDKLMNSELDLLTVSLDGASQKSASIYQRGCNFDNVINNFKKITKRRAELGKKTPAINWRFVVNRYNEAEIPKAREITKEIGIDILDLTKFRCDTSNELLMNSKTQFENVEAWLPKDSSLSMYNYSKKQKKVIIKNDCNWLWTQSAINWNGSVAPCCAVWHEKFDFGKVDSKSFFEIWNNEKHQEARNIIAGRIENPSGLNICHICKTNNAQLSL